MNLTLATPITGIVMVPGEVVEIDFHVHEVGGSNFHWTSAAGGPYTPKAKLKLPDKTVTVTGTVVSAAGGTATVTFTAAQTETVSGPSWADLVLYADPNTGSENLHIATIPVRVTAEVIP